MIVTKNEIKFNGSYDTLAECGSARTQQAVDGVWYAEIKLVSKSGSARAYIGFGNKDVKINGSVIGLEQNSISVSTDGYLRHGWNCSSYR